MGLARVIEGRCRGKAFFLSLRLTAIGQEKAVWHSLRMRKTNGSYSLRSNKAESMLVVVKPPEELEGSGHITATSHAPTS
jgi:hypothetical protein